MISMKKKLALILSILIIAVLMIICDRFFMPKTAHGIRQADCLYAQPADSIDVLFLGTSHIHCNVNTELLWEKYGIAAYDYSAAEQPLWITYYYMKEALKRQSPTLIVLDVFGPARRKEDYQYRWLGDNTDGVRFSFNKMAMLLTGCERSKLFDYFPSWMDYHTRYNEFGRDDIRGLLEGKKSKSAFKGYTPYFETTKEADFTPDDLNGGELTEKSKLYLKKIIELADKENIDLFITVTPYRRTPDDIETYAQISELAENYDVDFYDANDDFDTMGLSYDCDFYDKSHLNYQGSCTYSEFLGQLLKEKYDIPDRRGNEKWESWDRQSEALLLENGF